MGLWIFLGSFLAVSLVLWIVVGTVKRKLNRFSQRVFGTGNIINVLEHMQTESETMPRSLNGCDTLLLPRILRDFPDYDASLAKTYARDHLLGELGHHPGFTVHNIVIAQYIPSAAQKTIVFQAALSWKEHNKTLQKRYSLDYTYLLGQAGSSVAANCPNCGAALGYGESVCSYCGSRVANILGNTWKFTELREC
jgi:hypothetical protein